MKNLSIFAFFITFLSFAVAQNPTTLLTPEKLWELGRVNLEDVSPDGKKVLYTVTTYNLKTNKGETHIYISDTQANGKSTLLTNMNGSQESPRFRPDGKRIGFISAAQMYEMDLEGNNMIQCSDQFMNGFAYAPDSKHILFINDVKYFRNKGTKSRADEEREEEDESMEEVVPPVKDEDEDPELVKDIYPDLPAAKGRIIDGLMYRHWKNWDGYQHSNIFIATYKDSKLGKAFNIMKNEPYDAPPRQVGGMEQITWSPDGKKIAYSCRKLNGTAEAISTNTDIYLYDLTTKKTDNLTEGMNGYDTEPTFSPDGKMLAWTSMERAGFEADRTRILVRDFTNNSLTELTKDYDRNADHPQWSQDGTQIYFITQTEGTRQLAWVSVNKKDDAKRSLVIVTNTLHDHVAFKVLKEGSFVTARQSMAEPTELYLTNLRGTSEKVTNVTTDIWATIKKASITKRIVQTTDKKEMLVWQITPPDFDPTKKYPTLLYCQGGPQSMVSQSFSYRWNLQLLAAQGYIVIAPCRRGMPGFGQAWNDQISTDWGGQVMQDMLSAIDDASRESYVDKERLAAVGASYGGYTTFWLAGNHQKRFKTFLAHAGIFNLESFYGTTDEVWFAEHDMGGAYWQTPEPKSYRTFSPHLFVQNWDTPILITHGDRDYRVTVDQSYQAFQAAQLRGIPSRLVWLPEEGHHISKPQNSVFWYREVFKWLEKYLK